MKESTNITINGNVTIVNAGTERSEDAREALVNHDEDILIDNETSFDEMLALLRRNPTALAAEKEEQEMAEMETKLRAALGDDYELYTAQEATSEMDVLKKAARRPGPVQLWKNYRRIAVKEIGENGRCEVYENGYGVYDNGNRRTVLWVLDCRKATYYFAPLLDHEKEYLKQIDSLDEDVLGPLPWYHAITIAGEDRIEQNMIHPKSAGTTSSFDTADEEVKADHSWRGSGHIDTPEEALLRKEAERERLSVLTPKQKEVYVLRYREGYTEAEIGKILGLSRSAVRDRLECIREKLGKNKEKFF